MASGSTRFRTQVVAHFGGRPGQGARYPEALRTRAVELALAELAAGRRLGPVAEEMGISAGTLGRWMEAAPAQAGQLRTVEVVAAGQVSSQERGDAEGLVLVTAAGHRVEGLALAEVALLLEALA